MRRNYLYDYNIVSRVVNEKKLMTYIYTAKLTSNIFRKYLS